MAISCTSSSEDDETKRIKAITQECMNLCSNRVESLDTGWHGICKCK